MKAITTDIRCMIELSSQAYVSFRYQFFEGQNPLVEFETEDSRLLRPGRTPGRIYSFTPMNGVRSEVLANYWMEVFNESTVEEIRASASELPDKLRKALDL